MAADNGVHGSDEPRLIAFYLPQFHPIPENDEWWGRGFTEWRNVVRARPSYPDHYQPHIPGELGFYDLRLAEAREAQASLARQHGISAFCYYHYWFHGRRVLERPFDEVRASGRPDFPFCLCWANEPWTRNWDGGARDVLIPQRYSEEDDRAHIRWLIEAFRDHRYVRVHGRPLLMVYNAGALPDPARTTAVWRQECDAAGVEEPFLVKFNTFGDETDPRPWGFDAAAEFLPHGIIEPATAGGVRPLPDTHGRSNLLWRYDEIANAMLRRPLPEWTRYQCVVTGWDNTPRKPRGQALIMLDSTPEGYERWLRGSLTRARTAGHEFVFVNAWNEWAESAHLEPDLRHGRGYLEATARVTGAHRRAVGPLHEDMPAAPAMHEPTPDLDGLDRSAEVTHRALVAREMEHLMRQIQELEDKLAAATGNGDPNGHPEHPLSAQRQGGRVPVVRRLLKTAAILGRELREP